jgi:hypothetical protein
MTRFRLLSSPTDRRYVGNMKTVGRRHYEFSQLLWFSVMSPERYFSYLESKVRKNQDNRWSLIFLIFFFLFPVIKYFMMGSRPTFSILRLAA